VVVDFPKAAETVKQLGFAKFDETVDLSVKVNLKKANPFGIRWSYPINLGARKDPRIL